MSHESSHPTFEALSLQSRVGDPRSRRESSAVTDKSQRRMKETDAFSFDPSDRPNYDGIPGVVIDSANRETTRSFTVTDEEDHAELRRKSVTFQGVAQRSKVIDKPIVESRNRASKQFSLQELTLHDKHPEVEAKFKADNMRTRIAALLSDRKRQRTNTDSLLSIPIHSKSIQRLFLVIIACMIRYLLF